MAKQKSTAEISAQIETVQTEIRQGENYIKRLQQQNTQLERKARTRRLIERGAMLENLLPNAKELSNEQIQTLLSYALKTSVAKEILCGYGKAINAAPVPNAGN